MSTPTTPTAGWYKDPAGSPRYRWWDGNQWTENLQEPYSPAVTPVAVVNSLEGAPVYTVWIWLIVFLPLLSSLSLFTINWGDYLRYEPGNPSSAYTSELALMSSPGYLLIGFGNWVIYGLCAFFAYLDWKQLKIFGMPRPFHFGWVFLSSIVYVIGRSVVARRRTGRGIAPMWAAIGTIVLSVIISIVLVMSIVGTLVATMPAPH